MSQEQIETLISKIWWRMPEIFDHNHDWIEVLIIIEPKESYLFTFYISAIYRITFALVKRRTGPLVNALLLFA